MKRSALALACSVLVAASLGASSRAYADPPPQKEVDEARAHFNRGVKFYQDSDFRSALVEFQEAYRIAPNPKLYFNIAQTYEELGDFAGAMQSFRDYLAQSEGLPKARRTEVEKALKRLESHVATAKITVNETGADVSLEGERHVDLGKSPLPAAVLVNGGKWTVVAKKDGFVTAEEPMTVAGGDTKEISLTLKVPPPPPPPPPPPKPPSRSRLPVFVAGGVTGALVVGATITGILTLGKQSDFESELNRIPGNAARIDDARSSASTMALVTDILAGAAIVGAVGTVVLYFVTSPSQATASQLVRGRIDF